MPPPGLHPQVPHSLSAGKQLVGYYVVLKLFLFTIKLTASIINQKDDFFVHRSKRDSKY